MNIRIIDNFLKNEDINEICSLKLFKKVSRDEVCVYHNAIDKNNIKAECLSANFVNRLHKNYHDVAINLLKERNPEKVKLYDYSEFQIIETGADYKFPIHDDTPDKLLSGIIYLKPQYNTGTVFYKNRKGEGKKTIDWKINRAVFFSRKERETWHSYRGDGVNNRVVLVYNLMTKKVKEVYEIENKSFFLGEIRHKLNPLLYRYFKILI